MDLAFDERAMVGLTYTERKIMEEYLKGLKPKEIARRLKVSIKTVYKAVWKYRKNFRALHGIGKKSGENSVNNIAATAIAMEMVAQGLRKALEYSNIDRFDEALVILKRIEDKLSKINNNLSQLIDIMSNSTSVNLRFREKSIRDSPFTREELPEFIRGNPWLEVLRTRPSG